MKAIHTPTGQVVEAIQWKGDNFKELDTLTDGITRRIGNGHLLIPIYGGSWAVDKGEYVTKSQTGELYIYSKEYFDSFFTTTLNESTI